MPYYPNGRGIRLKHVSVSVRVRHRVLNERLQMSDVSVSSGGGVSFLGLLTIVFIVLKLTDVIAWSWLWVLAPLWIPSAILLVIAVISLGGWLIYRLSRKK